MIAVLAFFYFGLGSCYGAGNGGKATAGVARASGSLCHGGHHVGMLYPWRDVANHRHLRVATGHDLGS